MEKQVFRVGIRRSAAGERRYVRRIGEVGCYAQLRVRLDAMPGLDCSVAIDAALRLPADCLQASQAAILRKIAGGSGEFPFHGFVVTLLAGSSREGHSPPEMFTVAAESALEEGLRIASRMLLEPWVGLRIQVREYNLAVLLRGLTEIFGEVKLALSWRGSFVVEMEVPVRALESVQAMLGLREGDRRLEVFPLSPSHRYREVPFRLGGHWMDELGMWT